MDSYTQFASIYDEFMEDVPYDEWLEYVHSLLIEFQIKDGLVCDLGCGTGNMTRRLANVGYDMIGVDLSMEMLQIAKDKDTKGLYLNQDMAQLELYGTCRAFVSLCDTMNYLDREDFLKTLIRVNNYLDAEGIFIFDLKTKEFYRTFPEVFAQSAEDSAYIWENYYDEEEAVNEYDLTIFKSKTDGLYERYTEVHVQFAYTQDEIEQLVRESGMSLVRMVTDNPERMYVIAREQYQPGKTYEK